MTGDGGKLRNRKELRIELMESNFLLHSPTNLVFLCLRKEKRPNRKNVAHFSKIYFHASFQDPRLNGAIL
jgi:hypothetical protein